MQNSGTRSGAAPAVDLDARAYQFSLLVENLVRRLRSASAATPGAISSATASALGRLEQDGPLKVTRLAQVQGVSQPAMTQLVDRVVKAGLARRTIPDDDRRSVFVEITPSGIDAVAARRRERSGHLHDLMQTLTVEERAAIITALPALERLTEAAIERGS